MVRLLLRLTAVLAVLASSAPAARAASKVTVAALGDPAPGGGQFAGPGFTGWPAAAGSGWIAFRAEIVGGGTSEALVAARMTPPVTRRQVASLGQTSPGSDALAPCAGTFRQFVGRPSVNANGDVAFLALVSPETPPAGDAEVIEPQAAGVFLFRDGQLRAVACSGQQSAAGKLDLTAIVDPFVDPTGEIPERAPALNDLGDVAFLAGFVDEQGLVTGGGVFLAPLGGDLEAVARLGDGFEGGEILNLGPPALNNARTLAFHAFATTNSPDDDGIVDGVFTASAGVVSVAVRDGVEPAPLGQPLLEFQDAVSLNDAGDIAFLAGPLFDLSDDAVFGDEETPGVLVLRKGALTLVGYPGQHIGPDRVAGFQLGSGAGGLLVPPALTPQGQVVFLVQLNSGSGEAIVRWEPGFTEPLPLVYTLGSGASDTPVGGVYNGAQSAPATDAAGGTVFRARISGGATIEALVYRPPGGAGSPIVVGDAAPSSGFFAGRPFSPPIMNDRGDVVFRAFVARGPASVGIFQHRDGNLLPLVRAGEPSPNPGNPPFLDLAGEPSLNAEGAIAFAATVSGLGRGIYATGPAGARRIAARGDAAPGPAGATFSGVGANPAINDDGAIAFRGTTSHRDPLTGLPVKRDGLFLADRTGIRTLVLEGEPSPAGLPFFQLRDAFLSNLPRAAFRASLGTFAEATTGLFVADPEGTALVVLERQVLSDDMMATAIAGHPAVSPAGQLAFTVSRARQREAGSLLYLPIGPAILRQSPTGLVAVAAQGDHVPAGGTFRTFAQPSIADGGHVAFRASFQPFSGGAAGLYLVTESGPQPLALQRELTPLDGRFASFGARLALNRHDEFAFTAGVTRGRSRNALFVAYPTALRARRLAVRLGGLGRRDRLRLRLELALGRVNDGLSPAREAVSVSLGDANGPLWTATVPARQLRRVHGAFVATPARRSELGAVLRALHLTLLRGDRVRVAAVSAPVGLTNGGFRALRPPFTLGLQVGGDSGTTTIDCAVSERGVRCGA